MIPVDWQLPVGATLIALCWIIVAILFLRHLVHNERRRALGYPRKSLRQHVVTHAPHHAAAVLAAAAGVAILLGVGVAYAVLHHGGARFDPHIHIAPPHRPPRAGGAGGVYVSPDLYAAAHMIPYVPDQDGSNSCCGWAVVQIDQLMRALRYGEHITLPAYPSSGFKPWTYAGHGQNVGTTIEDEAAALNAHGHEALAYWPLGGYETPADAARSYVGAGASNSYDYYDEAGGGRAGLNDVEWRLDHMTPMILVWAVHQSSDQTPADGFTDDTGVGLFYHCVVATRWTSNYQGHGEAVQVANWWSLRWGLSGFGWISARAFMANIKGASTWTPGARIAAWEPPPTPRPTATPIPTTRPTPAPTAHSAPAFYGVYLSLGTNLREKPAGAILVGLSKGTRLRSLGLVSGGWVRVQLLVRGVWRVGWVPAYAVVRSTL